MPTTRCLCALSALVFFAGTSVNTASAQQVQRYIGSPQSEEFADIKPVFVQGNFDGYVSVGFREFGTSPNLNRDFWVVRTDAMGNVVWTVRFGGAAKDEATSVVQTVDGGFAVVGETTPAVGGNAGIGLLKLNSDGTFAWARAMTGGGFTERVAVQQSRTPGATVTLAPNGDITLVSYYRPNPAALLTQLGVMYRWTNAGVQVFGRVYSDTLSQTSQMSLTDLRPLPGTHGDFGISGTFLFPFQAFPGGPVGFDQNPMYMRVDATGAVVGVACYPTFGANNRRAVETGDGLALAGNNEVVISGYTDYAVPGPVTITGTHLLRVNALNGAPVGMNRYQNFFGGYASIASDPGTGHFLIAGSLQNSAGLPLPVVASLLRVDAAGDLVWNRGYAWPGNNSTIAHGLALSPEPSRPYALAGGGFPVGPYGSADGFFVRTNNFGLTGCRELSEEPRITPAVTTLLNVPLVVANLDGVNWQATHEFVAAADTAACQGVGCCNLADVTSIGGSGPPCDGQLTVDDLIAFVNAFGDAIGCPGGAPCNFADVTAVGGPPALPDGQLTVDDIIAFVNAFGDGCL
jgi:hypothetical protein